MIADQDIRSDYSADVRLRLEAEGRTWPLAKMGKNHVVAACPIELPPCDAVVILTVDGAERRWNVRLIDGATPIGDIRTRPR
jgi:hypothetical protein